MSVEAEIHNQKFQLVNIHAPNTGGSVASSPQKIFFDNLDPYLQTNHPLILGGDFNFVEDQRDRLPPTNQNQDRPGKISFQQIKNVYSLSDPYGDEENESVQFTRESNSIFSRIDRFYIQNNTKVNIVRTVPTPLSDHKLVYTCQSENSISITCKCTSNYVASTSFITWLISSKLRGKYVHYAEDFRNIV